MRNSEEAKTPKYSRALALVALEYFPYASSDSIQPLSVQTQGRNTELDACLPISLYKRRLTPTCGGQGCDKAKSRQGQSLRPVNTTPMTEENYKGRERRPSTAQQVFMLKPSFNWW